MWSESHLSIGIYAIGGYGLRGRYLLPGQPEEKTVRISMLQHMNDRTPEIAADRERMSGIHQLLVFTLDDRRYALPLPCVMRVLRAVEVTPLPGAPDVILGIISLQGRILPVFHTRKRFRLPGRELDIHDQLVLIRTARRTIALLVDRVADVVSCSDEAITGAESILPNLPHVRGILQLDDGLILIEDAERFLSLDEETSSRHGAGGCGRRVRTMSTLPDLQLAQVSRLVADTFGLCYRKDRYSSLEQGLRTAASDLGYTHLHQFIADLTASPQHRQVLDALAERLVVGETYFFREEKIFDLLRDTVLPELIRERSPADRHIRIWSAGCSTGEEPYSLAMMLTELLRTPEDWTITILGTDISANALRKASAGIYTGWSFRNTPAWVRDRYFTRLDDGTYLLDPRIRSMVTFSYLNLMEETYPSFLNNTSGMDLILCRNTLMYFCPEHAASVVQKLHRSLSEGGWLVIGVTETAADPFGPFTPVRFPKGTLYRKISGAAPTPPEAPLPPESVEMHPGRAVTEPVATVQILPRDLYIRAARLYEQGCYGDATPLLQEVLRREPGNLPAILLVARVSANQGDLNTALAWCEKAIAADKLNPEPYYLRAAILQEKGELAPAVASLRQVLYLDPGVVLAHYLLGVIAVRCNRRDEAERHFTHALALLESYEQDEALPFSEGISAGTLAHLIVSVRNRGVVG